MPICNTPSSRFRFILHWCFLNSLKPFFSVCSASSSRICNHPLDDISYCSCSFFVEELTLYAVLKWNDLSETWTFPLFDTMLLPFHDRSLINRTDLRFLIVLFYLWQWPPDAVYPKKYAHGFVVLCFVVVMQSFIMNSHEVFIHIHQGCFAGTGAI